MKLILSSLLFHKKKESWLWPSCKNPKTLSFRATSNNTMFKTVNSVYFDPKYTLQVEAEAGITTPDSCFTNSSESASISTESEEYLNTNDRYSSVENIVRGARSERLFFEPGPTTSSILPGSKHTKQCMSLQACGSGGGDNGASGTPYKESVAMSVESKDPQGDFKKSMEEMVEMHGLKDWECLEELLRWYLRLNGKNHHEFIVGAFVDLLAGTCGGGGGGGNGGSRGGASPSFSSGQSTPTFTSVASAFGSPVSSPLSKVGAQIVDEKKMKMKMKTLINY